MFVFVVMVLLIALLGLASQMGWSSDSRDSADWTPSDDGLRSCH